MAEAEKSPLSFRRAERWPGYGILFLAVCLFLALCGPMILAPAGSLPSTEFHDFFSLFYPAAEIFRGLIHDGGFPLWNPYSFCGMPFLASPQMGALYPPNWLHVLISPSRAFNLLLVGHTLFAGLGTWLYCRGQSRSNGASLFAAVVFAFSGRIVLHQFAGHPHIVYSAAWLPFIFWLVDRCLNRPTVLRCSGLAVGLALHFLVGFPMLSLALGYLIPIYVLMFCRAKSRSVGWTYSRAAVFFFVAALLGAGLVSAQLIPTLEFMEQTHRGGGLDYAWATTSSFPPINLLAFGVPGFFGDHVTIPYWGETSLWESTAYCGITTVLLMLIGLISRPDRPTLFWGGAAVVLMLIALGKYSFLYDVCYWYLPGFDLFRGISKLSVFAILAMAIVASRGFDRVFSDDSPLEGRVKGICIAAGVAGAAGVVLALFEGSIDAPPPPWWLSFFDWVRSLGTFTQLKIPDVQLLEMQSKSYEFMLSKLLFASTVLALSAIFVLTRGRLRRFGSVLMMGLLSFELFVFAKPYFEQSDASVYREPAQRVRQAIHDESLWRFSCVAGSETLTNQFAYEKLAVPGGVDASLLKRYMMLFQTLSGAHPQLLTYLSMPVVHEPLFDLLNIKYYAAPPQAMRVGESSDDPLLVENVFEAEGVSYNLYKNADVLPRALIVHKAREIDYYEAGQILLPDLMKEGPLSATFVEGQLPFALESVTPEEAVDESCQVTSYQPDRMVIDVELKKAGLVLVLENAYPGWQADVDGEPVEILPANLFMRAIPVPAGKHTLTLQYQPKSFRLGGGISGLTICLVGVLCVCSLWLPACNKVFVQRPDDNPPARILHRDRIERFGNTLVGVLFYGGGMGLVFLWGGWLHQWLFDVSVPNSPSSGVPSVVFPVVLTGIVLGCGWHLRKNRRALLFGMTTVLLMLPLTLIAAECFSRFFVPAWPAIGLHGVEPSVAARSWAKGISSSEIGVNDWGQRDRPRQVVAPAGVRRIAFIGDSFLEESTSVPISIRVEEGLGREDVEVINLGVSASSPDEYYYRLQNVALPLGTDHCVMFIFAGNDFVEPEQSLESFGGIAAVFPRGSFLSSVGLKGINHLLTNRHRPVLKAWLGASDLRKSEELKFLALQKSSDAQIRQLLFSRNGLSPEQADRLQDRLADPGMAPFFEMLRNPDAGQFRSYYLTQGLWAASVGKGQWDENSEESTLFWVQKSAELCQKKSVDFTLVIVPEGFSVDSRMVAQWAPLADMRHLTQPCRDAALRLRQRVTEKGIAVVDLHEAFQDVPGTYLNMDGHWSDRGVALAAKVLVPWLETGESP